MMRFAEETLLPHFQHVLRFGLVHVYLVVHGAAMMLPRAPRNAPDVAQTEETHFV